MHAYPEEHHDAEASAAERRNCLRETVRVTYAVATSELSGETRAKAIRFKGSLGGLKCNSCERLCADVLIYEHFMIGIVLSGVPRSVLYPSVTRSVLHNRFDRSRYVHRLVIESLIDGEMKMASIMVRHELN